MDSRGRGWECWRWLGWPHRGQEYDDCSGGGGGSDDADEGDGDLNDKGDGDRGEKVAVGYDGENECGGCDAGGGNDGPGANGDGGAVGG